MRARETTRACRSRDERHGRRAHVRQGTADIAGDEGACRDHAWAAGVGHSALKRVALVSSVVYRVRAGPGWRASRSTTPSRGGRGVGAAGRSGACTSRHATSAVRNTHLCSTLRPRRSTSARASQTLAWPKNNYSFVRFSVTTRSHDSLTTQTRSAALARVVEVRWTGLIAVRPWSEGVTSASSISGWRQLLSATLARCWPAPTCFDAQPHGARK